MFIGVAGLKVVIEGAPSVEHPALWPAERDPHASELTGVNPSGPVSVAVPPAGLNRIGEWVAPKVSSLSHQKTLKLFGAITVLYGSLVGISHCEIHLKKVILKFEEVPN